MMKFLEEHCDIVLIVLPTLGLITLKLLGKINLNWFWVFTPIWCAVVVLGGIAIYLIYHFEEDKKYVKRVIEE